jgi:hypothetical protein
VLDEDLAKVASPIGEPVCGTQKNSHLPQNTQPKVGSAIFSMLLKDVKMPKFTGEARDFWDWRVEFCQFIELLSSGGELPEVVKLEVLGRSLDKNNSSILRALGEGDITYERFMHILDSRCFEVAQIFERQKWESLVCPDPSFCSRDTFRLFRAKFVQCRNRVAVATIEQEYRLLMGKLPKEWRIKVLEEEQERCGANRVRMDVTQILDWI